MMSEHESCHLIGCRCPDHEDPLEYVDPDTILCDGCEEDTDEWEGWLDKAENKIYRLCPVCYQDMIEDMERGSERERDVANELPPDPMLDD